MGNSRNLARFGVHPPAAAVLSRGALQISSHRLSHQWPSRGYRVCSSRLEDGLEDIGNTQGRTYGRGTQCFFFLGNLFFVLGSRPRRIRHPYPFSALMTTISGPRTSSRSCAVFVVHLRARACVWATRASCEVGNGGRDGRRIQAK